MAWDPDLYLTFRAFRERPALDLLAQVDLVAPNIIHDLGGGTGDLARLMAERWPDAHVTGVDSSPDMLAKARAGGGRVTWRQGDVTTFRADPLADLLFSNAVFNWVPRHDEVLPRLMQSVLPGGMLALQMPRIYEQAAQREIAAAVQQGPWRDRVHAAFLDQPVQPPETYYRILAPYVRSVDIWETNYIHVLTGDNPVLTWMAPTALRPFYEILQGEERERFEDDVAMRLRHAYPVEADGRTLFPLQRLFIVARR
jgi:trans-aconitate 2-methyltransferase